tara:strand:+ start:28853 stop:29785 length:933 start_codon:yes stop_codon:yes gene_type:complete
MKKILNFFLILLFLNIYNNAWTSISNKIVVKVENEIITNYDIKNKILSSLILAGDEINQENIDNLKRQALDSLIQLKLKKIELKKTTIQKDNKQINSYLNSISSNDIVGLRKKFENNGLDYELFVKEIEIQFKWQELIYKLYSKKIQFDEGIINKDLEKLIKNQSNIVEFNLSEIELATNDKETDKEVISNLLSRIDKEGFEAIAIKYSISSNAKNKGNLGWINSNALSQQILDIVSKMRIGEVSSVIKRQGSLLILKLNDKRISKTNDINVAALKENLIVQKRNELFNLHSRSHLSKLRNTILIQYNEK